jgi:hypothetical protein
VEKVHTVIYREVNDNPYDDYRPGHQQTEPLPPQGGHPPRGDRRR